MNLRIELCIDVISFYVSPSSLLNWASVSQNIARKELCTYACTSFVDL